MFASDRPDRTRTSSFSCFPILALGRGAGVGLVGPTSVRRALLDPEDRDRDQRNLNRSGSTSTDAAGDACRAVRLDRFEDARA